jgi:hypothetical protein
MSSLLFRARVVAACGVAAVLATGCSQREPGTPVAVDNTEYGYHFELPPRWINYGDETRSLSGSVFTVEIVSLTDADPRFLAGLPETIVPQIEARTRYYFAVVNPLVRNPAVVDGRDALAIDFPVRVRPTDRDQEVRYWILREGDSLFLLRATIAAGELAADHKDADAMVASFRFTKEPPPPASIGLGTP